MASISEVETEETEDTDGEYLGKISIGLEDSAEDKLVYTAFTDYGDNVGMLQIGIEDLEYSIDGLYVAPIYRRAGIGSALLDTFLETISDDMTMPCSMTFNDTDAIYGLMDFFLSRNDFTVIEAGISYRLKIGEFLKNENISAAVARGCSSNIIPLGQLDNFGTRELISNLERLDLAKVRTPDELKEYYDPELSSVALTDGVPEAAILAVRYSDTEVIVDVMYSLGKNIAAFETIVRTVQAILKADPDMDISVFTISDSARNIMDKLISTADDVERNRTYIANWLMIRNLDMEDLMADDSDED